MVEVVQGFLQITKLSISLGSKAEFIVTSVTSQNDEVFLGSHDLPSSSLESQFEAIALKVILMQLKSGCS